MALLLLGQVSASAVATVGPPSAAVVNGVHLEMWEAERELAQRVTSTMFHRRIPPERMQEFRKQALDALVLKELKIQWAEVQREKFGHERADAAWQKIRDRFDSETAYLEALDEKGASDQAFRRAFKRDAVAEAVDRMIQDRVDTPSGEDVVFQYLNHKDDYSMPESAHVVHLLVYVSPNATAKEREKAENRTFQIIEEARSGTPLVDLVGAAGKGLPPKYHDQVGDLGFVHRGTMVGGLDDVVFSAPIGKVVGPERSLFGYHIFQVLESKAGKQVPFEQVEAAIVASLERGRRSEALTVFEEGLLASAEIEIGEWVESPV